MTATTTATLTDFLLARLGEDEAAARAASEYVTLTRWVVADIDFEGICILDADDRSDRDLAERHETYTAAHIARHDPARVLAEVAAKRAVVAALVDMEPVEDERREQVATLRWTVQHLAAVYASHPDYDERWAVQ